MDHLNHLNRELVRLLVLSSERKELIRLMSDSAAREVWALYAFGCPGRGKDVETLPEFLEQSRRADHVIGYLCGKGGLEKGLATAYEKLWPESPLLSSDWSPSAHR